MTDLLLLFIVLNVLNVIIQTVKSIATIKSGKIVASLVNALAYGFYTIVIIYMNSDLGLWSKVAVVAGANLMGVYFVKLIEEKLQKDKLWKVETTFTKTDFNEFLKNKIDIPYNYIDVNKYMIVNFYCENQKQTSIVKELLKEYNVKYFIAEAKTSIL